MHPGIWGLIDHDEAAHLDGLTHGLAEFMKPALAKLNLNPELLAVADGARRITAHAKLCKAKIPPLVTVIPDELDLVNGRQAAITGLSGHWWRLTRSFTFNRGRGR